MNWEASETVEQENDKFKRWIKESICIRAHSKIFSLFLPIPTLRGDETGKTDQVRNSLYLKSTGVKRSIRLACLEQCFKKYL